MSIKKEEAIGYIALVIIALVIISAIMYGMRLFSNATTPITVKEVKKGVSCASMITNDGAAISCWKD